jgi:hypothetical protein
MQAMTLDKCDHDVIEEYRKERVQGWLDRSDEDKEHLADFIRNVYSEYFLDEGEMIRRLQARRSQTLDDYTHDT